MIVMTLVHGNDDVLVGLFSTLGAAQADAVVRENQRHGTEGKPLSSFFDWIAPDRMQFGTDYHYVTFYEADPATYGINSIEIEEEA